jgi:7-cyano-7-deazaguanine synthase
MRIVLIYSGGMDSTVLLYEFLASNSRSEISTLSVNYGQRHRKELEAARAITAQLGVRHCVADLSGITSLLGGSSQTSDDIAVPEGHYAEESMKKTVVPNRNMIMLAIATGWAISQGADQVAYAAHGGDHAIYPDCRMDFVEALRKTISLADWHQVDLLAPYLGMTKTEIAIKGHALHVPFKQTWSCYKGETKHCGRCGTCTERREAFELAGIPDPTEYDDVSTL